ncbi:vacuolar protein sorting-associated protein 35B-like isoform X1 [Populus alba x Populus x berolinensis]|uniref:Vacuolar protein sorting-associated protein 35B-like isoform X1 n=1 Tax=Populus alba x Populus x berolinensis TaxID=444605 RepID=A0AAD6W4M3_9ROSI|nr:vacuolar protein sorting-associated protein 35B-like isoform X1 [Populus alba x Populus x berolinensis]
MKNNTCISTADKIEVLFELLKGLIKGLDGTAADELDEEDFNEEQNSVARLIHMLYNDDSEEMVKEAYNGWRANTITFTVPPHIFSALRLVRKLQAQDGNVVGEEEPATPKKIFQLLNEALSYYMKKKFVDSKAQVTAMHLIIGLSQRIRNVLGVENRDTLTHKATGYFPAKLLE